MAKAMTDMTIDELVSYAGANFQMINALRVLVATSRDSGVITIDHRAGRIIAGKTKIEFTPEFLVILGDALGNGFINMQSTLMARVDAALTVIKDKKAAEDAARAAQQQQQKPETSAAATAVPV